MSPEILSLIALCVFLLLMFLGMPLAFAFALVGGVGLMLVKGPSAGLYLLGDATFSWGSNVTLLPLILFILMGQFVFFSGIGSDLFDFANKWMGRYRGGLAIATNVAGTVFGACCGLSIAASATLGTIAYPEMLKYKYDKRLAITSIAGGSSLSDFIPPSSPFIILGFLTQTSIGALFIAGILPGIILSILYIILIVFMCWKNPLYGPNGEAFSFKEMLLSLKHVMWVLLLVVLVLGGLFAGLFTASEAGAIGAFGAFLIFVARRKASWGNIFESLKGAVVSTSFILTITICAMIFSNLLAVGGFTTMLTQWVNALPFSHTVVLIFIFLIYIPLGAIMDVMSMTLLTIPIIYPIVRSFGVDPIWFCIMVTLLGEMSVLAPPQGINSFVIHGITKAPLQTVYKGVLPVFCTMFIFGILLFIFPQIATFLPSIMK